jgi:hypothetical protein
MEQKNNMLVSEIEERTALYERKQAEFEAAAAQRSEAERAELQADIAAHVRWRDFGETSNLNSRVELIHRRLEEADRGRPSCLCCRADGQREGSASS